MLTVREIPTLTRYETKKIVISTIIILSGKALSNLERRLLTAVAGVGTGSQLRQPRDSGRNGSDWLIRRRA